MGIGIILTITFSAVFGLTVLICLIAFRAKTVTRDKYRLFRENNETSPDANEPLSKLPYNETLNAGIEKRKICGLNMGVENVRGI